MIPTSVQMRQSVCPKKGYVMDLLHTPITKSCSLRSGRTVNGLSIGSTQNSCPVGALLTRGVYRSEWGWIVTGDPVHFDRGEENILLPSV